MPTMEKRVANTVALLDKVMPDWRKLITQPVHMGNPTSCIIGQLFDDFWNADLSQLGYVPQTGPDADYEMFQRIAWAIEHGLAVPAPHESQIRQGKAVEEICGEYIAALEMLWADVLNPKLMAA